MLRISPLAAVVVVLSACVASTSGQQTPPTQPSAYVQLASHEQPAEAAPAESDSRRLAPPSSTPSTNSNASQDNSFLPQLAIPRNSMASAFAALALVVGIFLFVMSLIKRNIPKSLQFLPAEVATVLGRMPLAGKQFAHLIKLGDKLVLISISPTRIDTISEVTDPEQVARLLSICSPGSTPNVKQDYDQILRQLAAETDRHSLRASNPLGLTSRGGQAFA